jgi:LysM repeat protein
LKGYIGPRPRWWLPLAAAGIFLIGAGVLGYSLAQLVAVVASAPAPRVTLAPSPLPTPPDTQVPTASPTASPTVVARPTSSPSPRIHVVQAGEYVSLIAERYGVTPQAILRANNIPNPNYIEVGDQLVIPDE